MHRRNLGDPKCRALGQTIATLSTGTLVLASGRFLYRQNDSCDGVYLLTSGKVELIIESGALSRTVRKYEPGSIIGLPECLNGASRIASARALSASTVSYAPLLAFTVALRQDPTLCLLASVLISEETYTILKLLKQLRASRPSPRTVKRARL